MNLYEIMMEHYAQKGSEEGVFTYLVAENDEEVYEWIKSERELKDGRVIYNSYRYYEEAGKIFGIYDEEYNIVGEETFKERIIRLNGDMNDENIELTDLYYGKTLLSWKMVKENISEEEIKIIKNAGVCLETV